MCRRQGLTSKIHVIGTEAASGGQMQSCLRLDLRSRARTPMWLQGGHSRNRTELQSQPKHDFEMPL